MTIAALASLTLLAACASDGRDLAAAQDWQTTTTRPPPPTAAVDDEPGVNGLRLTSPAFEPGGELPISATCAGENIFPDLSWGPVDPATVEIVVVLADQTDPKVPVLMWLLAGISADTTNLVAGVKPEGSIETTDDYGITGWGEPCLDSYASGKRDLQWLVYLLDRPSELEVGHPGNEAWEQVRKQAIESASLLSRRFNDA